MDIKEFVHARALDAKAGARALGRASTTQKDKALHLMAAAIRRNAAMLMAENAKDIELAQKKGISEAMIDRLTLNANRIEAMALGIEEVAVLRDPVGEVTSMRVRPNGLRVGKMRVPIGVIGIIYESRPNVTADATALCMKAGNAVLLRGGSEAINSNRAIVNIIREALDEAGIHAGAVTFIDSPDRDAVSEMVRLEGIVDLIIPRGGESLIRAVTENSRIPVLKHYKGVCHIFVDRDAEMRVAEAVCMNAKAQRPATCNAMETMLVDEPVAAEFLPVMLKAFREKNVEIRGCEKTLALVPGVREATDEDFHTEYNDYVLNVKVVTDMDDAMDHIAKYGSAHTESIITKDYARGMRFVREVDSSSVMINASTRFSDGFEYGLGAEIGIATDKIHARGPMGLDELTCQKFIVFGDGQTRG